MTYEDVVRRIAGRAQLVGVVKGHTDHDVAPLLAAGLRDIADNRVDEMISRTAPADVRRHFIGNLQSRDLRHLTNVALVHSFDRPELASRWPRHVPVLLQVDFQKGGPGGSPPGVSIRPSRNGIAPKDVRAALAACHALDVRGLSTLPPQGEDPRPHFKRLRELRDELGLKELSMGMSADFEVAIEEGATMVRVGHALFQ